MLSKLKCINVFTSKTQGSESCLWHHHRTLIEEIYTDNNKEIWWDKKVTTIPPLKHNKPDGVYWNKAENKCYIIDIAIGLDINVGKNVNLKYHSYISWAEKIISKFYVWYNTNCFRCDRTCTVWLTGKCRKNQCKNIKDTMLKCQRMAFLGTMKIVKSVLKMKNIWRIQFIWLVTTYSEAEPLGHLGCSTLRQLSTTSSSWLLLKEVRSQMLLEFGSDICSVAKNFQWVQDITMLIW